MENLDRLEPQKEQLDAQITPLQEQLEDVTGQIEAIEALVSGGGQLTEEQQAQLSALNAAKAKLETTLNGDGTAENPGLLPLQKQVNAALAAIDGQLAQRGMNRDTARQMLAQLESAGELSTTAEAVRASYQTLLATRQTLDSSWAEYYDGQAQLRAAKRQLDEAWAELEDAREELEDGWAELEDARLQLEDAEQELRDGERELADGRAELDDGWREYYDGLQELEDAKATLAEETADAQAELDDALAELNDGEAEYAEGLAEYEDGRAEAEEEIAEAQKELEQARRDIESIEACEWYLLDRNTNAGYVSYSMDADRMGNLASVFPLIFFLVAALVCLTTMTRMVEEQRIAIGGLKALGYSRGAIAVKYVGYGFLASAVGALLGLAVGLTLLPWIICNAWNIIYTLGPRPVRAGAGDLRPGVPGRRGDRDALRPGRLLLHPHRRSRPADAAQGAAGRQAGASGAVPPDLAAAHLQLQDHHPEPVPLPAAVLDDRRGHRRVCGADRHRLRPAGVHLRHHGQAVR